VIEAVYIFEVVLDCLVEFLTVDFELVQLHDDLAFDLLAYLDLLVLDEWLPG
jgi:hypothetical protein